MALEGKFQKDEVAHALAALKLRRDFDDLQAEMSGINNGRQARFLKGSQLSEQAKAKARAARERLDADIFYLTLIQNDQLGSHIGSEMFDRKSDWQIFDIVSQIEARTGMRFEDYAARILGSEAAQRKSGESDADYKRRVLKALAEEMLEADGSIKAQYAHDPLAAIIRNDDAYRTIMDNVARINRNGPGRMADSLVAAYKKAGYASAKHAATHVEHDGYSGDLRDGQNGHRETSGNNRAASDDDIGFLAGMNTKDTAMSRAADAGRGMFNVAAKDSAPVSIEKVTPSIPTPETKAP